MNRDSVSTLRSSNQDCGSPTSGLYGAFLVKGRPAARPSLRWSPIVGQPAAELSLAQLLSSRQLPHTPSARVDLVGREPGERRMRAQDLFVQAVSAMFGIGMDLGFSDRNPAARIPRLNDPQSYEPWPAAAHQKFIASEMPQWMRTTYVMGLWTAQREGALDTTVSASPSARAGPSRSAARARSSNYTSRRQAPCASTSPAAPSPASCSSPMRQASPGHQTPQMAAHYRKKASQKHLAAWRTADRPA